MVRDITSRPANYAEIEKLCQEQFTATDCRDSGCVFVRNNKNVNLGKI